MTNSTSANKMFAGFGAWEDPKIQEPVPSAVAGFPLPAPSVISPANQNIDEKGLTFLDETHSTSHWEGTGPSAICHRVGLDQRHYTYSARCPYTNRVTSYLLTYTYDFASIEWKLTSETIQCP